MKIGIDVDDVVADLHPEWIRRCNEEAGTNYTAADMTQWDFYKDFGWTEEFIYKHLTPDLYDDVLPCAGAPEMLRALREMGHQIVFITTCHTQEAWAAKVKWLLEKGMLRQHDLAYAVGPWTPYKTKGAVCKDHDIPILVDDSVANCEEWPRVAYLVTRPHNRNSIYCGKRVRSLQDVVTEISYWRKPLQDVVAEQIAEDIVAWGTQYDAQIQTMEIKPVFEEGSKPTNPKDAIGSDKLPLHLWPMTATVEGSLAMLEGALKYGRNNFRAIGVRSSIYVDAAMRHLAAWMEGEDKAPDSGISHLGHALACLAIVVDAREANKLNDDRNISGGYLGMVARLTPEVKRLKDKYADRNPKHYTIQDNEDVL